MARLASIKDAELLKVIPVKFLRKPSIHLAEKSQAVNCATMANNWTTPIIQYLKDDVLLEDKSKARLLRLKVARYLLYDGKLYKRGFSTPLLKYVDLEEWNHILREIHDGVCSNHAGR